MNEKELINSAQAYALDSLSIEKKKEFEDRLKTAGDETFHTLGEYMNLTAMLPSFLDLDTPSPEVLTQLMSDKIIPDKREEPEIENEVTVSEEKLSREEKIRATIQNTLNRIDKNDKSDYTVFDDEEEFIHDEAPDRQNKDEESRDEEVETIRRYSKLKIKEKPEEKTESVPESESEIEAEPEYEPEPEPEPEENVKRSSLPVPADFFSFLTLQMSRKQKWKYYITTYAPLVISFILLILFLIFYIGFTSQIDELQNRSTTEQGNLSGSQDLMAMFLADAESVELANLKPTDNYLDASGKLLLNPDDMNGLLQLNNLNTDSDISYRMWTGSAEDPIPLGGILYAKSSAEFYPVFNIPDTVLTEGMALFITQGKSAGTGLDPETICLTGAFNTD